MIFLDQSFGSMNIGISTDIHSFGGGGSSWNGMYTSKEVDGKLYLSSQFSIWGNQDDMSVEDVVKDIWKTYINPYLQNQEAICDRRLEECGCVHVLYV